MNTNTHFWMTLETFLNRTEVVQDKDKEYKSQLLQTCKERMYEVSDSWIEYNKTKACNRPKLVGTYLVCRYGSRITKDKWDGRRWSYDDEGTTHFKIIVLPKD